MLRALRDNPHITAAWLAAMLLLPVLVAERLALPARYVLPDHGGREFIAIRLLYLIPLMTASIGLALAPDSPRRVFASRLAYVGVACLAVDAAVYALAGVLERSFKATLAFPLATLGSLGALLTGIVVYRFAPRAIDYLVATATSLSAAVGGLQIAEAVGLSSPVGSLIVQWDKAAAHAFHTKLAWMRAEGLALNPNMYTPFAIVGFIWALFGTARPAVRWIILTTSTAIAVLGASETTAAVLLCLLMLALLRWLTSRMNPLAARRLIWASAVIAVLAGAAVIGVFGSSHASWFRTGFDEATVSSRLDVPEDGLDSRLVVWGDAVAEIQRNPWGTFGRTVDRLKPYTHAHNEILQRFLYAGPLWPIVYVTFLAWLLLWLRPRSMRWIGVAIFLSLALNGATEALDKMHPYHVLLYAIIGSAMWQVTVEREQSAGSSSVE